MCRFVEMRHALVHPINRDRVLNEIVRADAEEIDFAREKIRGDRGARDLDHRTDFHLVVERMPFAAQFLFALINELHRLSDFTNARYHREHHPYIAGCTGAQDGAELHFEDFPMLQTKPDCTPSQDWIHLIPRFDRARDLITTEIERANDQRVRQHAPGYL